MILKRIKGKKMTIAKNGNGMPLEEFEKFKHYTGLDFHQLIVLSIAGSQMYGTNTPASDKDFLGIYMPTREQLFLNNYPKQASYPKSSGLDLQVWSIHYFLKLACQGETMAIDLLHAPDECIVAVDEDVWPELVENRKRFYTKQMKAFVSYARKQAAKYGIKGTRIEALEKVVKFLNEYQGVVEYEPWKLRDCWEQLPKGEHIHFLDTEPYKMYQVCGKKFQETVKVDYAKEHLQKSLTEYGKRAMLARDNQGIDWKAISHALRASDQVYDILRFGDYEYPLRTAAFLRNVKLGKFDFQTVVQPVLEEGMNDVEKLMETTDLPEKVDIKFWNDWLIELMQFVSET